MPGLSSFNYQHAAALKAAISLAAAALLAWWWYADRRDKDPKTSRRDGSLAILGVLGFVAWWNFGSFLLPGRSVHYWEFFHYYLGSKYSSELAYTRLYDCVAAAEIEQGRRAEVTPRWIRNLTTNELRRGSQALRDASLCRDRFATPERWNEFKHDVAFFREQLGPRKWLEVQMDHGYNASPVWTVVGRTLANTGPASTRQIDRLWWLDPLLILAMWATVWWAFGWRVVSVAVIWWGTNYAAPYNFIGGAFLRQDWLFLAIAGICLVKRGWPAIGGFALAWSTLLRIFPGFILLGLFLKIAADSWRTRRLAVTPAHVRFAGGAILALIVWIPLTLTLGGGETDRLSPWKGFVQNTRKLASSQMTNSVGLPVAIAFSPANRIERVRQYWLDSPWDVWKEGRRQLFQARRFLYLAAVAAFVVLLTLAVRGRDDWVALTLGIGAIPILAELSSYYYGILLGLAFVWPRNPVAGVGLALTACLSNLVLVVWSANDDRYLAISVFVIVMVTSILLAAARRERTPVEEPKKVHT